MKSCALLAASALLAACVCQQPAPATQPQAATTAAAPVIAEPTAMSKEAEQVIAISEKSDKATEKEPSVASTLAAPLPPGVSRCWLRGDMRTITTEQGKDGSCQVVYDSASQSHVVASKGKELAECNRLHERLKKNLIASGFKCE